MFYFHIEKVDQVLDETENTESMVNQLLYRTFTRQQTFHDAVLLTDQKVRILRTVPNDTKVFLRGLWLCGKKRS